MFLVLFALLFLSQQVKVPRSGLGGYKANLSERCTYTLAGSRG